MIFKEGNLQFNFSDDAWTCLLQFDKTPFYPKACNAVEGTKGVDFMGVWEKQSLVLVEVKDFRSHRIEAKPKVEGKEDPLWLEVARKMRDSVAVAVGAGRNSSADRDAWKSCLAALSDEKKKLHLILWVEQDPPLHAGKARRNRELNDRFLLRRLKNSLEWLTTKVEVADTRSNPFPYALTVTNL